MSFFSTFTTGNQILGFFLLLERQKIEAEKRREEKRKKLELEEQKRENDKWAVFFFKSGGQN